jgi:ArsR family transcriptional regulator, arsenate/arsenite/antimonite-responsive transcriptional repressor
VLTRRNGPEIDVDSARRKCHFDVYRSEETHLDAVHAIAGLSALAQEHRLALFRLLVEAGETGMAAGAIADRLGVPNSSLSFHLAHLSRAGLLRQERRHRSIIYRADYDAVNALVGYLMENCCGGEASCAPRACAPTQERQDA